MTAQHRRDTSRGTARRRWRVPALLAAASLVGTAITFGVAAPAAEAADSTATISLTGVTSNTYPVGGNTVWVQPGTSLTLTEAPLSAGANQGLLGAVSNLVGGLLGAATQVVDLQANVDLSSVGKGRVTLGGGGQGSVATPALAKGVYPFTWSFTAITLTKGLLGGSTRGSVALDGNQLNSLGIKLNASNQYIGYIVSDTKSPCAGTQCIALQTPTLSVAPSLPVVGQLPTVTVPGQNVSIPVPGVPGVNTSGGSGSTPSSGATTTAPSAGATPGATSGSTVVNPYGYTAPGCTGPCLVVPKGGGGGGQVGAASNVTLGDLGDAAAGSGSGGSAAGAGGSGGEGDALAIAGNGQDVDGQLAVDRAFAANGDSSPRGPGLPTSLTIAAIAALAGAGVFWFARRRLARG